MPICPKCGKTFSTEQALQYHLNKKYKCGTWKCGKCNTVFNTQFALKIHNMNCESDKGDYTPSYDILCNIYNSDKLIFMEKDEQNIIHSLSPGYKKLLGTSKNLIGTKDENKEVNGTIYHSNDKGEIFEFNRIPITENIFIDLII